MARLSDDDLRMFVARADPDGDVHSMARELIAARRVVATARALVDWAEPVTTDDWAEYDAAILALREYDAKR